MSKIFLVTYDLGAPETRRNYVELGNAIKSMFSKWARPAKSVWLIQSDDGAGEVRDAIKSHLDSNDKLLVVSLGGAWGTFNISKEVTDWMRKNI